MRVYIKNRYSAELDRDVVNEILTALGKPPADSIQYDSGDGRAVIIDDDDVRTYVIVSRRTADARNAFLNQYISTVLAQYIADDSPTKRIGVYLLDTTMNARTPYMTDTYRSLRTLGIGIINEAALTGTPIRPYTNFDEWKNAKIARRNSNRANNATYALADGNEYTVFGKLYGANGKDATLLACQLAQIARGEGKRVTFVPVMEHGQSELSDSDLGLMRYFGVEYAGALYRGGRTPARSTCRRQDEFRYNLLEKYGHKKCYLCDCDIEQSIIASHVHRIKDIDDDETLTPEQRREKAVDADNGLWLCANHDKMFEYGVITFDADGKLVISDSITPAQKAYIESITTVTELDPAHYTAGMREYMRIHNARVHLAEIE